MRRRPILALLVMMGLVTAAVSAPVAAAAPGPSDYGYEREWIYSTASSEVPIVAVNAAGTVFLVGSNSGYGDDKSTVRVYNAAGALITMWEVNVPYVSDITTDAAGNVLITDYNGGSLDEVPPTVKTYTPTGQLLRTLLLQPPDDSRETVGGVGVGPDGRVYVASPTSDNVVVFNANGTRAGTFSGSGTAPGQLRSPWGLDVAPTGQVVVADQDNDRVQVFTADGAYVTSWGQAGSGPGQFFGGPGEVEVRDDGFVYVADNGLNRVQVFTLAGAYVGTVSPTTKRSGDEVSPVTGLAVGPSRELYISGTLYPFENGVARYLPAGATAPPPTPPPPTTPPPTTTVVSSGDLVKAKRPLQVKKKRVVLRISCPATAAAGCAGRAQVTTTGKKSKAITKSVAYFLEAGAKATVRAKVTKAGARIIRSHRTTKAVAKLTTPGQSVVTAKVKIRR